MKKAFTLAEILIVLAVIGVITAILLPAARHVTPDENVLKFKKAHNTFYTIIRELSTSDLYFKDGDFGIRASDGQKLTVADKTYFCDAFSNFLSYKEKQCDFSASANNYAQWLLSNEKITDIATGSPVKRPVAQDTINAAKERFDYSCKNCGNTKGGMVISSDDVVYYQAGANQFGSNRIAPNSENGLSGYIYLRYFSPPDQFPANYGDENGFDIAYKVFCIDVDGLDSGEDPFGYGVRADGKILNGARADQWLQKSINHKD